MAHPHHFKAKLQDVAKLQLQVEPAAAESVLESESQEVVLLGFHVNGGVPMRDDIFC